MKQILYFDDEVWQAKPLEEILETSGEYHIQFVSNIRDFFEALENPENTYDLFMLDVMIPMFLFDQEIYDTLSVSQRMGLNDGLDTGLILFEIIRQNKKYATVPVIFYTAKNNNKPTKDPNIRWISKPKLPYEIEEEIKKLFSVDALRL